MRLSSVFCFVLRVVKHGGTHGASIALFQKQKRPHQFPSKHKRFTIRQLYDWSCVIFFSHHGGGATCKQIEVCVLCLLPWWSCCAAMIVNIHQDKSSPMKCNHVTSPKPTSSEQNTSKIQNKSSNQKCCCLTYIYLQFYLFYQFGYIQSRSVMLSGLSRPCLVHNISALTRAPTQS